MQYSCTRGVSIDPQKVEQHNRAGKRGLEITELSLVPIDMTYLERPRSRKSTIRLLRAMQLIRAVGAELTQTADARNPLDARPVTDLPNIMHGVSNSNDRTGPLVPSYALGDLLHGQPEAGPFVVDERLIAGTKAAPVDLDEDLVRVGLGDVDLGHWGGGGVAAALADGGILLGGDVDGCHFG